MSGGARQITVTFAGEDRGLKKELKEAGAAADDLGGALKRVDASSAHGQMDGLTGKAGGLRGALGGLKDSLSGELSSAFGGVTSKMGPMGSALDGVVGAMGAAGPVVAGVAGGLAAAGAVAKVTIGAYVDLADSVREFRDISGASAEDSSRFVAVLDDLGISSEAGAKAIGTLMKNADSKAFAQLGIEIAKTKDGAADSVGTFQNLLEKVQQIPDPIERTNVLNAAMGKSWQGILPLVQKTGDEFERMMTSNEGFQILSDKDLADTAAFKATMDELSDTFQKFVVETGKFAMPIVKVIVEDIAKFGAGVDKAGEFIGGLIQKFGPLETVAKGAAAVFLALPLSLHALINISFEKVQNGLQAMINVADKIAGPFVNFPDDVFNNKQVKITNAVGGSIEALKNMEAKAKAGGGAMLEMGDSAEVAAEKQKVLDKALADLEASTGKQLAAIEKMPAAHKAVEDAARALADAHTAERTASEAAGAQTKTSAQDRLAEAQAAREHDAAVRAVSDAKTKEAEVAKASAREVHEAERAVADLRATQPALAEGVRKAQADLAESHRDAARAADEEEAAQRRYKQVTGELPPDIREVTKAQEAQLAVSERLAALSDDLVSADQRLTDAKQALADAEKNLPAEAQEAMAAARIRVVEATERQSQAEAKLAADRAAGKPAADIARDEREVEQAKMATAQATREQERANREWSDTSDELAEKTIAVHTAERNLERVKRDQTTATKDQQAATKTLTEIQDGAAKGSDREREAKEKLTTAHENSARARATEQQASRDLAEAQKKLLELPGLIADAIGKLRDTETKASADRKAAHDNVTAAVDNQRLQGLKAAADAEKAEATKATAIAKTQKAADDYTAKALALVDAEVAAKENAAQRSGKALDSIGEANARLSSLEVVRRKALEDGHTKTVAELDGQIASIRNLRDEHDTATGKLKANAGEQVTAAKNVSTALDDTAKPRVGSIDVDKSKADANIGAVVTRLSNEVVKTHTGIADIDKSRADTNIGAVVTRLTNEYTKVHTGTLEADRSKADTTIGGLTQRVGTDWVKNHTAQLEADSGSAYTVITNAGQKMANEWRKDHPATMGVGNEATAIGQVGNVVAKMAEWRKDHPATMGVTNEEGAKQQVGNVVGKLADWKDKSVTLGIANQAAAEGQASSTAGKLAEWKDKAITLSLNPDTTKADALKRYLDAVDTYADQYGDYIRALAADPKGANLRPPVVPQPRTYGLNAGGYVLNGALDNVDSVLAALTRGEFVIRRDAAAALGPAALGALNQADRGGIGALIDYDRLGNAVARAFATAGVGKSITFNYAGTQPERISPRDRMRQVELMGLT